MGKLYIPEKFGNYSDILILFGVVEILKKVNELKNNESMEIEKLGEYFIVNYEGDIDDYDYSRIEYSPLLKFITYNNKISSTGNEYLPEWTKNYSNIYIEANPTDKGRSEYSREENIARTLSLPGSGGLNAFTDLNRICNFLYSQKNNFGELMKSFLVIFKSLSSSLEEVKGRISNVNKNYAQILCSPANTMQAFFPQACQGFNLDDLGTNRNISLKSPSKRIKVYEYERILATIGYFKSVIAYSFSKAGRRTLILSFLTPKRITLEMYIKVRNEVKGFYANNENKYNSLKIFKAINSLIDRMEELQKDGIDIDVDDTPSNYIEAVETGIFKSLPAFNPTNISKFVIPNWVFIDEEYGLGQLNDAIEDLYRLTSYAPDRKGGKQINIEVFEYIIRFLNSNNPLDLLNFFYEYNLFRISQIADNKRIRSYSQKTLEVVMNRLDKTNKTNYSEILKSKGFKNIARAIHNVTAVAIYRQMDKFIYFGLASELKRASLTQKTLVEWLLNFCSTYNANLDREGFSTKGKLPFSKIEQRDIEETLSIIEDYREPKIVGGLLLAYGLASTSKKEEVDTEVEETIE